MKSAHYAALIWLAVGNFRFQTRSSPRAGCRNSICNSHLSFLSGKSETDLGERINTVLCKDPNVSTIIMQKKNKGETM